MIGGCSPSHATCATGRKLLTSGLWLGDGAAGIGRGGGSGGGGGRGGRSRGRGGAWRRHGEGGGQERDEEDKYKERQAGEKSTTGADLRKEGDLTWIISPK
jgi:hypothetical protein